MRRPPLLCRGALKRVASARVALPPATAHSRRTLPHRATPVRESAPNGPIFRQLMQTPSRGPALLSPAASRGAAELLWPCTALQHSARENKVACGRLCPAAVHEVDQRCGDDCASSAPAASLTAPRALCAGLHLTRHHLDARLGASLSTYIHSTAYVCSTCRFLCNGKMKNQKNKTEGDEQSSCHASRGRGRAGYQTGTPWQTPTCSLARIMRS